ncbi:hypothetical protein [uncultured Corynebacterium sp.]|uniref:hypothetical protein n=1 Tax=uncultured Corynebacterium sp. TaxID=159447 RepID=UPI002600E20A|nr:hypothetical protein [uncultured Corynebacterium sp.]
MQKIWLDVEMLDGTMHKNVRIILADIIDYSDTARRHGWGTIEDDQIRATAFMAYAALGRMGYIDRTTYGFNDFVSDVAMVYGDLDGGDAVDPTQPATPGDSTQP